MVQNLSYLLKKILPGFIFFLPGTMAFGQIDMSGATCVVTELVYQYNIKGNWIENDKISICVDGGVLVETGTTCSEYKTLSFIKVQWKEGRATGKITLSSRAGAVEIGVDIAAPFNPGFIGTTDKQTINFNKAAPLFTCTRATGGNCSSSFVYQWERSSDRLRWTAINGATGIDLSLSTPLKQTTFFRRKAIETKSQTAGYSNEITVFVTPEVKKG